jgi:hypothetical protein
MFAVPAAIAVFAAANLLFTSELAYSASTGAMAALCSGGCHASFCPPRPAVESALSTTCLLLCVRSCGFCPPG